MLPERSGCKTTTFFHSGKSFLKFFFKLPGASFIPVFSPAFKNVCSCSKRLQNYNLYPFPQAFFEKISRSPTSRFQCLVKELFALKPTPFSEALSLKAGAKIRRVSHYEQTLKQVFSKKMRPDNTLHS
jgi:hypothetical protein